MTLEAYPWPEPGPGLDTPQLSSARKHPDPETVVSYLDRT